MQSQPQKRKFNDREDVEARLVGGKFIDPNDVEARLCGEAGQGHSLFVKTEEETQRADKEAARADAEAARADAEAARADAEAARADAEAARADAEAARADAEAARARDAEEQVRNLTNEVTCVVCKDRRSSFMFVPCTHMVCCGHCASNLPDKKCPTCRAPIVWMGIVRR